MKRLLVVEDDPDILEAVQLILASDGYDTQGVLNAHEAVDKVHEYEPDLIILDFLLAGVDGRVICRQLKTGDKTRHIPIIMVSAHPTAGHSMRRSGADSFIAKPFAVNDLLSEVKKHIGGDE